MALKAGVAANACFGSGSGFSAHQMYLLWLAFAKAPCVSLQLPIAIHPHRTERAARSIYPFHKFSWEQVWTDPGAPAEHYLDARDGPRACG